MSFNRLHYDTCQAQQSILESVGPGYYRLNTPFNDNCQPCYQENPAIRIQKRGIRTHPDANTGHLTNINSELRNITRPSTKCPSGKFDPTCENQNSLGYPCSQGVVNGARMCEKCNGESASCSCASGTSSDCNNYNYNNYGKNCFLPTEDTRLSNPPNTLRGTGINRFEWLCKNPQENVEAPFDYNINYRLIAKDNHRPQVVKPCDHTNVIHPLEGTCEKINVPHCAVPTIGKYYEKANDVSDYYTKY
jgi:hypothetical protein